MSNMNRFKTTAASQQGFTLLELVIVVIIIGILAAVAVPQFVNLSGKAEENALKAVAANLGSAATMNYAAKQLNTGGSTVVAACADLATLVTPNPTTSAGGGYTISGPASGLCTVSKGTIPSATFPWPGAVN